MAGSEEWTGVIQHDLIRPYRLGMTIPQSHMPEFEEPIRIPEGAKKLTLTLKGMHIKWRFE